MGDAKRRGVQSNHVRSSTGFEILETGSAAYAAMLAEARKQLKPEAFEGLFYLFKLEHSQTVRLHGWAKPSLKRLEICVQAVVWSGDGHCETPARTQAWYRTIEQPIVRRQVGLRVKKDIASAAAVIVGQHSS